MRFWLRWGLLAGVLFVRSSSFPDPGSGVFDEASAPCAVSYEGIVWYRVPKGSFSPVDVRRERCAPDTLSKEPPLVPRWARPRGSTKAIFVATSLEETYEVAGMPKIERVASEHRIPLTWMVGNVEYLTVHVPLYEAFHRSNGDDVQASNDALVRWTARALFPWFSPAVDVAGAGPRRSLPRRGRHADTAFWGIAWNSHGVDATADYGAPWGTYCADPTSYKRPDPSGECSLLAFEWTARDLTQAYLSGREDYFSTDPDDLRRAGFDARAARAYVREIVDAYAAAGEEQPLVVVSQQETHEENEADDAIMDALYGQAVADRMRVMTLAQAAAAARAFSAAPRAVAFPSLPVPAKLRIASPQLSFSTLYPATIDYHDAQVGMTFLAGHLLPTRAFRYAEYPRSRYDAPLPELAPQETPTLTAATIGNARILLRFDAPIALRYGVALWAEPSALGLRRANVTFAGKAGAVITFDLRAGANEIAIPCRACVRDELPYSSPTSTPQGI